MDLTQVTAGDPRGHLTELMAARWMAMVKRYATWLLLNEDDPNVDQETLDRYRFKLWAAKHNLMIYARE